MATTHAHDALPPPDHPPSDVAVREPDPAGAGISVLTRWVVPYAVLTGTVAMLVRLAARPISNYDTYFHLRFGHEFLGDWTLTHPGSPTSYGSADWVPTQWLPQVTMALVEDRLGLAGVAWLSGALFVALAVLLYAGARRVADPVIAGPVVAIAVVGCTSGLSMRPQVISYALVVVTVMVWMRVRETGRTPWVLVPLTWVWAMCHGMWPLGLVVGLAAAAGLAADGRLRLWQRQLGVLAASLAAASFLTPVGPSLLPSVLRVNSRGEYFSEWAPPSFTSLQPVMVLAMLALTLVLVVRGRDRSWFTIALIGTAGGFLVYSQRTVPIAACMLALLLAAQAQESVGARTPSRRAEKLFVALGAVASLAVLALVTPLTADRPPPQPAWVDADLDAMPAQTTILSDRAFGGYLMWRYPDLDFTLSGYGDIYTDTELDDQMDIVRLEPHWDDLVRAMRPAYAMLDPESPLAYALREGEGWRVVDRSEAVELLQPPPGWMAQ